MFRTNFTRSSLLTVATAAFLLAIASSPAGARPGKPGKEKPPTTEDVTGCLNTQNGRLRHLEEGDTPLRKCNSQESIVTLDVVGANEVEPFAFALDDGEEVVITESSADPATSFSVECAPPNVWLTANGTIINGAVSPVDLAALASETDLPVLLDDSGNILSILGVRVGVPGGGSDCIVTGVVQRSVLQEVAP